ncbi:MAG: DUF92 domain-containing protein [Candidatus Cyclonatronum sp.]|uniref:DUF92 domain-containing protein n=1 Tax=Cyclonatronum sp. TaxID=3024185 RepID=UPI0025C121ED|nr:DUF92 domain-containing protein [Cyclonatronum sp.]MCC5933790.1 DUF92 domain-containing protein [Balneolales bacterium]MCH8488204.1 DUF92 domain-containing protein [Cyclonatronum sp.]
MHIQATNGTAVRSFAWFNINLLNYCFYVLLILVFVVVANPLDKLLILLAFAAAWLISYLSFLMRLLSLDGMRAAVLIGTLTLGLGGVEYTAYLLFFFVSSNIAGFIFSKPAADGNRPLVERRTAEQVWANSFWFISGLVVFFISGYWSFAVAAAAAAATATSDTWATVIGSSAKAEKVNLITTFKKVPKGTDGGISFKGTMGGFIAALLFGLLSFQFQSALGLQVAAIVFISGFSGCLFDSYFGAYFQHGSRKLRFLGVVIQPGNHLVNFMATGSSALLAFTLYNILIYALV